MEEQLCIGTILCDNGELCTKWLDLQLRFLEATTKNFRHFTYISYSEPSPAIKKMNTTLVPQCGLNRHRNSRGHINGLDILRDYFLTHQKDCKQFLFLDMDAFPIRKDWQERLSPRIAPGKYHLATLIRPENLETRYHSSVLYVGAPHLKDLRWKVMQVGSDMIGRKEIDVKLLNYQDQLRDKVFVMVRSNKNNIHPLLCGVYYDMFYHHGCGSGRLFNMRARAYWSHMVEAKVDVMDTINQLMEDPSKFISQLAGWCPGDYPKV